ncbi:hypothetical protein HUG10_03345 [Halorarum halophilum]|uniref:Uncharacterized protein n=1 Tax=Halorarum halophilum TaxID=2743090 RepID=A0A7D5GAJ6_9EURY|nr:CFI-box-CTERM domain-containing protein [Halobaculum halophilum]QLG26632.1 hypothetical protein HUG10_03345 [Halobaculum halophilum]
MTDDRITDVPDDPSDAGGVGPDGAEEVDAGEPTHDPSEAVGDGRQKYVEVVTATGERHEHGDSYIRQSEGAIFVSTEPGFAPEDTVTYRKPELSRVTIEQHHSSCFITTAVAGEERTLAALRGFRDKAMAPSPLGRPLVGLYEQISPPIAGTLAERPDGATARVVRALVRSCAGLARRREATSGHGRVALSALLVALYVVGVVVAAAGHVAATLGVGGPNG